MDSKENQIKNLILEELEKYVINPKKKYKCQYIAHMVYKILQDPNENFSLQKMQDEVVKAYKLTNRTSLNISVDRYIKEIFDLTPTEVLKEIAHPYSAEHKPTVKEFLIHLTDKIEANINLY